MTIIYSYAFIGMIYLIYQVFSDQDYFDENPGMYIVSFIFWPLLLLTSLALFILDRGNKE